MREGFLKIYADIPSSLRKEIVIVLDGEPYTWNAVFVEVYNKTGLGERLLKELEGLKII